MRNELGRFRARAVTAAMVVCASLGTPAAWAQFAGPAVSLQSPGTSAPASVLHAHYGAVKIMPGDIIAIATYGAPELTTTSTTTTDSPGLANANEVNGIKVGAQGEIVLPYLGVVKVAGMTPEEAALYLEKELKGKGILVDPQVTVQLVDSPTRVITVVGEVQKPSPVPAFGQLRLLDVISACGGFTPLASHDITVRRPGDAAPITVILGSDPKSSDEANIPLMAGDTVIVPKVGNVFVIGQVRTPSAIPLSSNMPVTVMRAIAMAGGLNYGAALSKVMIIRRTANDEHVEIQMDLKKVMDGKEKDVALASDDVLLVPSNGFKRGLAAGGASVAASSVYGIGYIAKP
ncbi:MAG TPA: polysaccharide biosynthesis/export family protein [Acidobacteriaceae bacterium]|nr:polysaccharide biosynthesis/export family protein [Acidobacteriaceae bacterium]